jgi:3-hydroxybutyryl-CoA dehydrogenase
MAAAACRPGVDRSGGSGLNLRVPGLEPGPDAAGGKIKDNAAMEQDTSPSGISSPVSAPVRNFRIGVVGAGVMGRGIAQVMAQAGCAVLLYDAAPQAAGRAIESVKQAWDRMAQKGRLDAADVAANLSRLVVVGALADMAGCDVVIEAIVERLDAKQALFVELESVVGADTILATNTSSLSVAAIASACQHPERVAGLHFFNPVPLMRIVEIIGGARTAPQIMQKLKALVDTTSHAGVEVQDAPGFLINHAGRGYTTEALRAVQEGVAGFAEVDAIMREQVRFTTGGFKLGPFELLDLTGLDVSQPVMESIYRQFYDEPRFRPSVIGAQRAAAGLLGRKTGEGFYSYPAAGVTRPAGGAPASAAAPRDPTASTAQVPVFVVAEEHAPGLAALVQRLGGRPAADAAETADGGFVLIAPLGDDASSYAAQRGLPAQRTVAIDTLFDPAASVCQRRSIMPTVATDPAALQAAAALFAADGVAVSVLRDSTGFITQRIVAMIVSIGTEIAQQRIAKPADIDVAVRAGLGYPAGPLGMGDELGPRRILRILEAMHAGTGDPRYRPGLWLRRRALLGLSLLVDD